VYSTCPLSFVDLNAGSTCCINSIVVDQFTKHFASPNDAIACCFVPVNKKKIDVIAFDASMIVDVA
jgi:hypothetical protein